jgi:hypothetical protein
MRVRTQDKTGHHAGEQILRALVAADPKIMADTFEPPGHIDDPILGEVSGPQMLGALALNWLLQRDVHNAELGPMREMLVEGRSITECGMVLRRDGGPLTLPVAVVADLAPSGRVRAARIYHSTRPLRGTHLVRQRLLTSDENLVPPPAVQRLAQALANRDVEAAVACFDDRGYVREPRGFRFYGPPGLRAFFTALGQFASLRFEHGTITQDGDDVAIEHTIHPEGVAEPQAGLVVMRLGEGDTVRYLRVYNDIDIPQLENAFEIAQEAMGWHDRELEPTADRSGFFGPQKYHWP